MKTVKILIVGLVVLGLIGAIAGGGKKSTSTPAAPAVKTTVTTTAALAPTLPTESCHGVPSAACDAQINQEVEEAATVLRRRKAEATVSALEAGAE